MDQLLARLLESELLTDETRKELETAIKSKIEEAQTTARSTVEKEVRAALAEQWISERNSIIESLDAKIDDFLASELVELKEDIARFRDLEADYAEKLVAEKEKMQKQLNEDLATLTKKVSSFLEIRLNAEMGELKEDIEEMKRLQFGKKLYEAYSAEFHKNFNDTDGTMVALRDTEKRLQEALAKLDTSTKKLNESERGNKMREVLSPLSGRQREIMQAILKTVPTTELQEGYNAFIGRVLRGNAPAETQTGSEKEVKVLAEQKKETQAPVVKTGDVAPATPLTEAVKTSAPVVVNTEQADAKARLRALSGIS